MSKLLITFMGLCALGLAFKAQAEINPYGKTAMAVWANEAIIATYSYDYKNYVQAQKQIAKYFTAQAWIAYTKALNASKLPEAVQKNAYFVSAVATAPPVIKALPGGNWQADMPILVIYKNPQYQQQQNLNIQLQFSPAASGQGVRGFSVISLQSKVGEPPCICTPSN